MLDNLFLDDWLAVFRIALALLRHFKQELIASQDIAFVAQFFHHQREQKQNTLDVRELLFASFAFDVNEDHLDALEALYFKQQAVSKLSKAVSEVTPEEQGYVQQVQSFVRRSEPPLKRELAALQKKILGMDGELQRQQTVTSARRNEYEEMSEVREHMREKRQILYTTYTTLKREIHTKKQVHKMTILSQILRKRRN